MYDLVQARFGWDSVSNASGSVLNPLDYSSPGMEGAKAWLYTNQVNHHMQEWCNTRSTSTITLIVETSLYTACSDPTTNTLNWTSSRLVGSVKYSIHHAT